MLRIRQREHCGGTVRHFGSDLTVRIYQHGGRSAPYTESPADSKGRVNNYA